VAERPRRGVPDWLIGLLIAVVLVTVAFTVLGVGDDPSVPAEAAETVP